MGNLLPSGTCTVDERNNADVNGTTDNPNTCSGRVGNPALQPFQGDNRNISLEWYPTQDLMLSVAHYRNKIMRLAPRSTPICPPRTCSGEATRLIQ